MKKATTMGVRWGVVWLTVLGCAGDPPATTPGPTAWQDDFTFGPHAVGFRSRTITRSSPQGSRALEISVWYPALADGSGDPLEVEDYFGAVLREGQLAETEGLELEPGFAAALTGSSTALSFETARAGLGATVAGRWEATPAAGPFPLVLWSSRHATVLAQSPLSEVLASHGFVTATVWSSDPPLAFLWEDRPEEEKLATVEAHTGDLEHGLEELRREPGVDEDRVIVLAWSYGGQTAARLQERDGQVQGVIAMDANVVPATPVESLDLRRPLVYLVGRDTGGRGFERLQRLTAPWTAMRFPTLAHGTFNAMEGYLPSVLGADTVYSWAQSGLVARDGYRALVRVVVAAARGLVDPETTSPETMSVLLRNAAGPFPMELSIKGSDPP